MGIQTGYFTILVINLQKSILIPVKYHYTTMVERQVLLSNNSGKGLQIDSEDRQEIRDVQFPEILKWRKHFFFFFLQSTQLYLCY